jgi:NAD-dependent dihydropyrimidine dehydrogenase PreA subunit
MGCAGRRCLPGGGGRPPMRWYIPGASVGLDHCASKVHRWRMLSSGLRRFAQPSWGQPCIDAGSCTPRCPGNRRGHRARSPRYRQRRVAPRARPSGAPRTRLHPRRAARQLGLPPQERALASFHVEALAPTWSGGPTIRSFARIARRISPGRAMTTRRCRRSRRWLFVLTGSTSTRSRGETLHRSQSSSRQRPTTSRGWPRWRSSTRWVRARRSCAA